MIDFMNILAMVRSVAETGNVSGGFLAVSRVFHHPSLFGKIYYQVAALWLFFLQKIKILQIQFLFDTKPFTDYSSYLIGLNQWSPPLYQLIAIKLIQFFWDFIFLFFLVKLAQEIGIKKINYVILFWALNPFFMMVNYAIFMPEIAMLMCMVGGILFWIRALKQKNRQLIQPNVLLALFLFALGAIIKQAPLLLIPFVLILSSETLPSFLIYSLFTVFTYFILGQPWSADSIFIKQNFLLSNEALSIFRFTLNSVPVFLMLYSFLFIFVFVKKERINQSFKNILYLVVLILSIFYICDTLSFLQFLTWLLPFAALAALSDPEESWILIFSFLVLFVTAFTSSDYFSTLLSPTIGAMYSNYLTNNAFIKNLFNPELFGSILHTFNILVFIVIAAHSYSKLFAKSNPLSLWISQNSAWFHQNCSVCFLIIYRVRWA